jgi:hypothetical protein
MEIFPKELQWNIMKYMRHPTANILRNEVREHATFDEDEDGSFYISWNRRRVFIAIIKRIHECDEFLFDGFTKDQLIDHVYGEMIKFYAC